MAIGLCAILSLASVPAMTGWWAEYRLRAQADKLVQIVQAARLEAERTARAQTVILLRANEVEPRSSAKNIYFFKQRLGYVWRLRLLGQPGEDRPVGEIRIDASGRVTPVSFRVTEGEKHVEYRFDFLTGHAREGEASF